MPLINLEPNGARPITTQESAWARASLETAKQAKLLAAAAWVGSTVLEKGQIGIETDTGRAKFGDGVTIWSSLAYSDAAARAYADDAIAAAAVGLWDDRGNYNASTTNAYPAAGGSGSGGSIKKGDIWTISVVAVSGPLFGVLVGSTVRALTDTPGQTGSNWALGGSGVDQVARDAAANAQTDADTAQATANSAGDAADTAQAAADAAQDTADAALPAAYLDIDPALAANSDEKIPSQAAVKTYADAIKVLTRTVPNRFTADHSGWKLGDIIDQLGDSLPRVGVITIPDDMVDTSLPRIATLTFDQDMLDTALPRIVTITIDNDIPAGDAALPRIATLTFNDDIPADVASHGLVFYDENLTAASRDFGDEFVTKEDAAALMAATINNTPGMNVSATVDDNVVTITSNTAGLLGAAWNTDGSGHTNVPDTTLVVTQESQDVNEYGIGFYDENATLVNVNFGAVGMTKEDAASDLADAINGGGANVTATVDESVVTVTSTSNSTLGAAWSTDSGGVTYLAGHTVNLIQEGVDPTYYGLAFYNENNTAAPADFGGAGMTKEDAALLMRDVIDSYFGPSGSQGYFMDAVVDANVVTITSIYASGLGAWSIDNGGYPNAAPATLFVTQEGQNPTNRTFNFYDENTVQAYLDIGSSAYTKENMAADFANVINVSGLNVTAVAADNTIVVTSNTVGDMPASGGVYGDGSWVLDAQDDDDIDIASLFITQEDDDGLPPGHFLVSDDAELGNAGGYQGIGDTVDFLSGNGVPPNSIGEEGNGYVDLDTGDFYHRTEIGWDYKMNIKGPPGATGNGISSISRISGTGAAGSTDTYRITFTDSSTTDYTVVNGSAGATGAGYAGITSSTSLAIANSVSRVFTITAGSAFATGQRVRAANTVTPANYMEGIVTISGTTMTMTVDAIGGSGTFAAWTISVAGNVGTTGAAGGPGFGALTTAQKTRAVATWTARTLSSSLNWISACWSPELGLFCAVADGTASAATSPDGITWTTRTMPASLSWRSVCWSPELGLFCAVADGTASAATSPDGITWTTRTMPSSSSWHSICWSTELGLFCAISLASTAAATSPDGITWTARTLPSAVSWRSVCWSPELGLFCAVANASNTAATSPDGITWTTRTLPVGAAYSVCWSSALGLFCTVSAAGGVAATSPDGITWTSRTLPSSATWYSICWSAELGLFCTVSAGSTAAATSPDGITWTARTLPSASNWYSICWSPSLGRFCTVANASTAAATSTTTENYAYSSLSYDTVTSATSNTIANNVTLRFVLSSYNAFPTGQRVRLFSASTPENFVEGTATVTGKTLSLAVNVIGGSGTITSWTAVAVPVPHLPTIAAGITTLKRNKAMTTWTSRAAASGQWNNVTWSPELGLFCAVANAGTNRVMTSPDGITWTARTAAETTTWYTVCWAPELSLFCAVSAGGTNRVMTSPDGITWTSRTAAEANTWRYVTWSPELGLFCAVASDGTNRVMTSPDGITWTARAAAEANGWFAITWSSELSLFCAVSTGGTNRVMTSPNGITWTARAAAEANTWRHVTWSPELELFCAVGSDGTNRVMTSPDGITWTSRTAAEANWWYTVVWSPELGLFCAFAQTGTNRAMTSPDGITWTARAAGAASITGAVWSPELGIFCGVNSSSTGITSVYPKIWSGSGRYTPTLTNVTNIASSTSALCIWSRQGRVVNVSGVVTIDPTTTLTASELGISLPVPSNFTAVTDCGGDASGTAVKETGGIIADVTNDRACLKFVPTDVTSQQYAFSFSYHVK